MKKVWRTDGQTDWTILRAAWSQLKNNIQSCESLNSFDETAKLSPFHSLKRQLAWSFHVIKDIIHYIHGHSQHFSAKMLSFHGKFWATYLRTSNMYLMRFMRWVVNFRKWKHHVMFWGAPITIWDNWYYHLCIKEPHIYQTVLSKHNNRPIRFCLLTNLTSLVFSSPLMKKKNNTYHKHVKIHIEWYV